MCLLRFCEKLAQFFWAAQKQVVYVNVAADPIHQAVASFGNPAGIWATVILRHRNVSLVEDSSHNINGLLGDVECPSGKAMSKQMRENRNATPIKRLKHQPMHQKTDAPTQIALK